MKIRNGFVSNSSSTSFVVVVPAKDHERMMSEIKDDDGILKSIFRGIEPVRFCDNDVIVLQGRYCDDYYSIGSLYADNSIEEPFDHWYDYWKEKVDPVLTPYLNGVSEKSIRVDFNH